MAASCPACGRPVALARPQCLYCGAVLPAAVMEQAARQAAASATAAATADSFPPGPPRAILVLDLEGALPSALAAGLALSSFEAAQRVKRGGWQLHRIVPAEEADREAERLARAGLRVLALPEADVRAARPVAAAGGSWTGEVLTLRTEAGPVAVRAGDLVLVVRGPIAREYLTPAKARRFRTATLDHGYRFHLHRREDPRPLELDPAAFDFGLASLTESSLLLLSSWVEKAAAAVPVDVAFRREAPALAPAAPETAGIGAALQRPAEARKEDTVQVLDNLEQFRFYSAWRGCAARRAR
jgi:hypothetical protein